MKLIIDIFIDLQESPFRKAMFVPLNLISTLHSYLYINVAASLVTQRSLVLVYIYHVNVTRTRNVVKE